MRSIGRLFLLTCMCGMISFIILVPALPVTAAGVTLSPVSGAPGTIVTVTATGFTTGSNYTITFGSTEVVPSTPVPSSGNISKAFVVPTLPRGNYNVLVADSSVTASATFTITPVIWLNMSNGVVGDELQISGYGFVASTAVTISFDSTSIVTTYSDSSGAFSNQNLTIPSATSGWHTISARDYAGSSSGVVFVVSPKITLSTNTGIVGSSITCSGNGFAASSSVSFSLDGTAIIGTASTSNNGAFNAIALTVPEITGGAHTFQARDTAGNSATLDITVEASLTISPANGSPGTTITATGHGFQSNRAITITYNGVTVVTNPSAVTAGTSGGFNASFTAAALPAGVYAVVASDGTITASTQFSNIATVTMNPLTGAVGTSITASGSGFRPRSAVYVEFDDTQVGLGTVDINGNFNVTFTTPSGTTGAHQTTISDRTNTVNFYFSITPSISISPSSGFVDTEIVLTGTGFMPAQTVNVTYDTTKIVSGTTDKEGTFNVILKAPVSKGGEHLITASDGTSNVTTTFAMDAISPSAPELLLPMPLTKTNRLATLDWQEVNDPSGVTYTLQIATDDAFSVLVLQKEGLTTSAYTVTEGESLKSVSKNAPYYWRVKAIDAASNEGAWSAASTFYVGLVISDWAQYVIFGVIAILCGVIGYLIAVLRRRRKPPAQPEVSSQQ